MKPIGYWHIYTVNHWREIVRETLEAIEVSGLLEACACINVVATGPESSAVRGILRHHHVKLVVMDGYENNFEFPTLQLIWLDARFCTAKELGGSVFYIHTKGVSYPDDRFKRWRGLMLESVVHNHHEHLEALKTADVSGFNYLQGDTPHFSGNFWFARRSHIQKLPEPMSLDISNRYLAELWIASIPHTHHSPPFQEPNP